MILTVTLNPAVDKTCHIYELMLGQVNRLQDVTSIAGGKGVNVTKILRQFQYPVVAMGFLGGYGGEMIKERLTELGTECHFNHIGKETRVSTNILAENGYVTEILEPGPQITEAELGRFIDEYKRQIIKADIVVLSGSIPQGVPENIYGTLITLAKEKGKKVFLDTSGEALKKGALAVPYFLKPNKKEMEYLVGRKLSTTEEIVKEARMLLETGVEKVLVSDGAKGFIYVDNRGVIEQPAIKVKTVNTVACGDTLVASYCMSELEKRGREDAARCAAALAAANAATMVSAHVDMDIYRDLINSK